MATRAPDANGDAGVGKRPRDYRWAPPLAITSAGLLGCAFALTAISQHLGRTRDYLETLTTFNALALAVLTCAVGAFVTGVVGSFRFRLARLWLIPTTGMSAFLLLVLFLDG